MVERFETVIQLDTPTRLYLKSYVADGTTSQLTSTEVDVIFDTDTFEGGFVASQGNSIATTLKSSNVKPSKFTFT